MSEGDEVVNGISALTHLGLAGQWDACHPEEGCPWPGGVLILAFHPRDHEVSLPVPAVPGVQDAVAAPAQTHLPLPAEPSYSSRSSGAAPWV